MKKTYHTTEKEVLEREIENILLSIPHPFGTFEKAKYEGVEKIYKGYEVTYSFTTTCRSEENCIEIMKEKIGRNGSNFVIFKTQGGEKKEIYRHRRNV